MERRQVLLLARAAAGLFTPVMLGAARSQTPHTSSDGLQSGRLGLFVAGRGTSLKPGSEVLNAATAAQFMSRLVRS